MTSQHVITKNNEKIQTYEKRDKKYMVYDKKFPGGRDGDTFENPSPYEQLLPLPTPVLRCFCYDPLMTLHHPTSSILHCPSTTPSPSKNFNHTDDSKSCGNLN